MKSRFSKFNDGILYICERKALVNSFGAAQNVTKFTDLTVIAKMAYEEMSKRVQDIEFAESQGRSLSTKVKIRQVPFVNNKSSVVIDETLYDIYQLDVSKDKRETYLYLEEVRKLE